MKAALDVYYQSNSSTAACVVFENWQDSRPTEIIQTVLPSTPPYCAGRFYLREFPCLLSVLEQADRRFETLVIDGYVHLKDHVGKGLGTHLFESLWYSPAVIGVAKKPLKVADHFVPINRGRSSRPLFVSAMGCSVDRAARSISRMHGPYRIPTLLKLTDQTARKIHSASRVKLETASRLDLSQSHKMI
jgi:deoxyribonuclease V